MRHGSRAEEHTVGDEPPAVNSCVAALHSGQPAPGLPSRHVPIWWAAGVAVQRGGIVGRVSASSKQAGPWHCTLKRRSQA